ncbi:4-alpha-glucanotransferase [Bacteroidia bacterium]|nr:4-alpha-glucanotransferase [Bacteroidia bacterium]
MSVLNFDKNSLGNLEYSLQREMLATNRAGGYMSTTIVCCNTRKYHGLVVCPIDEGETNYVLLSSLDETVIQHDQSFNLAIHRFPGTYEPRGHKYITDFVYNPCPTWTYRVGGVILRKEMLWIHSRTQLLIKYTLVDAHSPTRLRLRPFMAFRDVHSVSRANMAADCHSQIVPGGVRGRMYDHFPWLYVQSSNRCEFVPAPDWYYNFEYLEEQKRGYPYQEDLMTPGYLEMAIEKGQSLIFSCGTSEADPEKLDETFDAEVARRSNKIDFLSCLRHSARQFIVRHGERTEVVAGYPWFGRWGRDTFISLPGIALSQGNAGVCSDVIDTMVGQMQDGLFPNMGEAFNSVDAPLWFFWTLQQLQRHLPPKDIWSKYGKVMEGILDAYCGGIGGIIAVHDNGLVWAGGHGKALTWMDAVVDGVPVTPRSGYQVEINALWYNAVCYTLELAANFRDKKFVDRYKALPEKIKKSFIEAFWLSDGYLADYVDQIGANHFIRPNQVIACALDHCMLSGEEIASVLGVVSRHLLTPKGLRTLSPRNPLYEGRYGGDQPTRDKQYHQGTVWPWLLEFYVRASFNIYGKSYLAQGEEILSAFEEEINGAGCIGSIAEIYDGDPPHTPRGAISQAWSVGAVLAINRMVEEVKGNNGK